MTKQLLNERLAEWASLISPHRRDERQLLLEAASALERMAPEIHPEDFCERCLRRNAVWFAPNEIWNKGCAEFSVLCPICFIQLAELAGIRPTAWKLEPEHLADEPAVVHAPTCATWQRSGPSGCAVPPPTGPCDCGAALNRTGQL